MALTTIAELRAALGVGSLYADATLQEVVDAADNVLLPFLWKNQQSIIAHSSDGTTGTLYFDVPIDKVFYVGQTVTISGAGSRYNGSKTITAVNTYDFNITITAGNIINPLFCRWNIIITILFHVLFSNITGVYRFSI
jgi:hypothetical protein